MLITDASLAGIEAILTQKQETEKGLLHMLPKLWVKVNKINQQLNYFKLFISRTTLKIFYLVSTF